MSGSGSGMEERSGMGNYTEPEGEDEFTYESYKTAKMIIIGLYVIIFLFSLVGNSLIIHLVRTRKSIRKNQFYWLIVNTAVADLVDVFAASAVSILLFGFGDQPGVFGTVLCKGLPYVLVVSICAAIWTLTVIAVDRYLVIVCLRRRALSSRSVLRSIIIVWLCAALVSSVYLYKYKTEMEEGVQYCYEQWHENKEMDNTFFKAEVILKVVLTYAVPLVVIAILYFLIARFLWTRKPPVSDVNQQAYIKQVRKRKTVIKMLITVVTVFAVCWFPVHVSMIMPEFYQDEYSDIPVVLRLLFFWLAHANAAIHPWLFIAFGEHFRRGTKEIYRHLLSKLRLCTGSTPNPGTNGNPLPRCVTPKGHGRTAEPDA